MPRCPFDADWDGKYEERKVPSLPKDMYRQTLLPSPFGPYDIWAAGLLFYVIAKSTGQRGSFLRYIISCLKLAPNVELLSPTSTSSTGFMS